jgi:hypothetical protein
MFKIGDHLGHRPKPIDATKLFVQLRRSQPVSH